MKNKFLGLLSIFIATTFISCTSKSAETISTKKIENEKEFLITTNNTLPHWTTKPSVTGSISSVGMTNLNNDGLHSMITMAELDAKDKLTEKIKNTVNKIQQKSMQKIDRQKVKQLEEVFLVATEEVTNEISLLDVKRVHMHQDEIGNLYVLMAINNQIVLNAMEDSKSIYKFHLQKADITKEHINLGMIVLDDMLEKLEREMILRHFYQIKNSR